MIDDNLQQFKDDLYDDLAASKDVRERSNEEYRFGMIPGAMWEGFLENDYENRAKLEMNHLSEYLRRTFSMWITNRQTVNYSPADDATSDNDAELLDGVLRRDMQRKGGQSSVDTAAFEGMACGVGACILNTEYEDDGDPDNEHQNIVVSEQPNAYSTVIWDAATRRADKSDAEHCTVLIPYSKKAFKANYPDKNCDSIEPDDRAHFNWGGGKQDTVYVAVRYEKKQERIELHTFSNPESGEIVRIKRDELEEATPDLEMFGFNFLRKKVIKKRTVYKTTFSATETLEKSRRIVGEYIPVIPFYGFRGFVDGQEYYHGLIRERMDMQRVLNMSVSLAAETAAHSSEEKPILSPEQVANASVAASWVDRHNKPFVLAEDIKDSQGNVVHRGAAGYVTGSQLSGATTSLIQIASESLRMGTGGAPQDIADPNASGKAINALSERIDMNTEILFDNLNKSIKWLGVVYESMAREVYGGKANMNRSIRTITDRGDVKPVSLMAPAWNGSAFVASNDLGRGKFEVVVGVQKDYATETEETFEALKDVVSIMPIDDPQRSYLVKYLFLLKEGEGLNDIQDMIRKELMVVGMVKPETEEDQQYMQQVAQQQAQAGQQPDPNTAYLLAEAEKAQSMVQLNQAKTAQTGSDAVKKAAEAERVKLESMQLARQLKQPIAQ